MASYWHNNSESDQKSDQREVLHPKLLLPKGNSGLVELKLESVSKSSVGLEVAQDVEGALEDALSAGSAYSESQRQASTQGPLYCALGTKLGALNNVADQSSYHF